MINPFYERRGPQNYCNGRRGVNIRQLILFMSAAALKTTVMGAAALILFKLTFYLQRCGSQNYCDERRGVRTD